ncbi:putative MATE family efflux protein [Chitinophaga terrae (ex Kim and Jung 2007)]|uniref:MATE family efflux transporter n=1 Tax=Chitinophaga terrae (ex Kim and Jung 2007) TaxID=408074 RepID=UPI002781DA52|nr:MATE family efflux transporter [Chitinophaga terrae (ex Kim and Jung 2007)]MDQ0106992.1 putative MATE family efflux protein [Chitinophaga terrae (ex Kim and Jung 2007)]
MQLEVNYREIMKIAGPICLALIIPQINHITNTAFLGRLGEFELAANGIAGIYYLVMYMIAYGLNNGMQVLIARRAGQQQYSGIGQLFSNGIQLGLVFSFIAIIITLSAAPWFFSKSLHDKHIYEAAVSFIRIRIWGLPFLMLLNMSNAFYIGSGHSKVLAATSLCQEFTNIAMDYLLIFGKLGLPQLGLNGAAVASVIAEGTGFIVAFTILFAGKYHLRYQLFGFLRISWKVIWNILNVSAPIIVQFLFSIGSWFVFFIFIEHLGERPLAVSNMLRSIFGLFGIFTWSLAAACNTMVSNVIGQGKSEQVFPAIRKIVALSLLCAVTVCIIINLFPYTLLKIYTTNNDLIAAAIPSIRVISLSTLLMAVSAVVLSGVLGTGNTRMNLITEIVAVIGYLAYCDIVIERMRSPLQWAWGADFIYWIIIFLLSYLYLRSGKWKGKEI